MNWAPWDDLNRFHRFCTPWSVSVRSSEGDEMHELGRFSIRKMQRKSIRPLQNDCQSVKCKGMELKASCDRGTEELIGRPITVQHCHNSFISNVIVLLACFLCHVDISNWFSFICTHNCCVSDTIMYRVLTQKRNVGVLNKWTGVWWSFARRMSEIWNLNPSEIWKVTRLHKLHTKSITFVSCSLCEVFTKLESAADICVVNLPNKKQGSLGWIFEHLCQPN